MKPMNFPGRKVQRQINAQREDRSKPYTDEELQMISNARAIRTKKNRTGTRTKI